MVLVDALNEDSKIIINNKAMRIRDWAKGEHAPPPQNMTQKNAVADAVKGAVKLDTTIEPPLNKLPSHVQELQMWAQSRSR